MSLYLGRRFICPTHGTHYKSRNAFWTAIDAVKVANSDFAGSNSFTICDLLSK
jgi:hypothetical protein